MDTPNPVRFFPPLTPAPGAAEVPRMGTVSSHRRQFRFVRCACKLLIAVEVDADGVASAFDREHLQAHIDTVHRQP